MSHTGHNDSHMLAVPQEVKKSALKKTSSVEGGSSLAVKGLGQRQKSFVQFDDTAVVIGGAGGEDKKEDKKSKGKNSNR